SEKRGREAFHTFGMVKGSRHLFLSATRTAGGFVATRTIARHVRTGIFERLYCRNLNTCANCYSNHARGTATILVRQPPEENPRWQKGQIYLRRVNGDAGCVTVYARPRYVRHFRQASPILYSSGPRSSQ